MSESGKLLAAIRDAIASGDAGGFERSVHTMRGMLRSLSAIAADELARVLQALDPRADRKRAELVCEQLEQAVDGLKAQLTSLAEAESSGPDWRAAPDTRTAQAALDSP